MKWIMMQTSELNKSLVDITNLIAPMDLQGFLQLLINNGFNKQGYQHDLQQYSANEQLGFFLHFATEGVFRRLYFQPALVKHDFLAMLKQLSQAPLQNTHYKTALIANFACSHLNYRLFMDKDVTGGTPREAADKFTNSDIEALLTCKAYGALPYFVIGDSHSRLYQHHGLFCSSGWLLPISITCSGG